MSTLPLPIMRICYEKALDEYVRNLTLEDIMESTPQATQRKITLMSLEALHTDRPDVQIFNELMIQYPLPGQDKPGQVVPDNMVIVHGEPIEADGSYNVPFQPVLPLIVLEYVSRSTKLKDYEISYRKYEQEVKVPYFLLFDPETIELILFHLQGAKYISVPPNAQGRHPIPEIDLEVAIEENWVRYWHRGKTAAIDRGVGRRGSRDAQPTARTKAARGGSSTRMEKRTPTCRQATAACRSIHAVQQLCFDFFTSKDIVVETSQHALSSDAGLLPLRH